MKMEKPKKKVTLQTMADATQMSKAHFFKIVTGKANPGKKAAINIGRVLGYHFGDVYKLSPQEIRELLKKTLQQR